MLNPFKIVFPEPHDFNRERLFQYTKETGQFCLNQDNQTLTLSYTEKTNVYSASGELMPPPAQPAKLTFSFDDDHKLTEIETNNIILMHEFSDKTSEQDPFKAYHIMMHQQASSFISDMAESHPILYSPAKSAIGSAIIAVDQRRYGTAHGPKGDIGYLATFSADPCIAVGLVAHTPNAFPAIHVMHLDNTCDIQQSISNSLQQLQTTDNHVTAYMASGSKSNQDIILQLFSTFADNNITCQMDFRTSSLILDLHTGQPIHKRKVSNSSILFDDNNDLAEFFDAVKLREHFQRTRPVTLAHDLTQNFSVNYPHHEFDSQTYLAL